MKPSESSSKITHDGINDVVERYETYIPKDLQILEEKRLREIPEIIQQRKKKDGNAFLEVSLC